MVELRPIRVDYVGLLAQWDEDPGVAAGTWALDIWIGSRHDRGRGLGAQAMRAAVARVFEQAGADTVVIDPKVSNRRAIAFYERLGFEHVGERDFDGDSCMVVSPRRWRRRPDACPAICR